MAQGGTSAGHPESLLERGEPAPAMPRASRRIPALPPTNPLRSFFGTFQGLELFGALPQKTPLVTARTLLRDDGAFSGVGLTTRGIRPTRSLVTSGSSSTRDWASGGPQGLRVPNSGFSKAASFLHSVEDGASDTCSKTEVFGTDTDMNRQVKVKKADRTVHDAQKPCIPATSCNPK